MSEALQTISVKRIDGSETSLGAYGDKVLLVVNVASQCGLTPQYAGLEALYERYRDAGLMVLGFPANEFGAQEPGTNDEIAQFCETRFGVQFPMFEKIVVKGAGRHPLYDGLTAAQPKRREKDGAFRERLSSRGRLDGNEPDDIMWNFEKFVVGKRGDVVARFSPEIVPNDPAILEVIEEELAKS